MSLSYRNQSTDSLNDQCPSHIETSQLICRANQLTGLYMRGTLVIKGLSVPLFIPFLEIQNFRIKHKYALLASLLIWVPYRLIKINRKMSQNFPKVTVSQFIINYYKPLFSEFWTSTSAKNEDFPLLWIM